MMRRTTLMLLGLVLTVGVLLCATPAASVQHIAGGASSRDPCASEEHAWSWPVEGPRVLARDYAEPATAYSAGHRGIDIAPQTDGAQALAPAPGVVLFAGRVVDRSLVTIDLGHGLVSTIEPVEPSVSSGDPVDAGGAVGEVSVGGHAISGTLHFGIRRDGAYVDPLGLLGAIPRAVLLPCC